MTVMPMPTLMKSQTRIHAVARVTFGDSGNCRTDTSAKPLTNQTQNLIPT